MGYLDELFTREYFDLVNEGDRLLELQNYVEAKNRFERAREIFDRVVDSEAERLDSLIQTAARKLIEINVAEGDRLKEDGELDAARERYAVALSLCRDEGERDEILIKMEYRRSIQPTTNFPKNLQRLFAELEKSPDSPEILYDLATELAIEGHPLEAIRYLERVVVLTPEDPDPYYRLGNAFSDVKSYDRAVKAFEKARELGFDECEVNFRLGQTARNKGEHSKAEEYYKKALAKNPEHIDTLRALASLYRVDEKPSHAIEYLTKITALDPEDAMSFMYLGEMYEMLGDVTRAVSAWKTAVRVAPDSDAADFAASYLGQLDVEMEELEDVSDPD